VAFYPASGGQRRQWLGGTLLTTCAEIEEPANQAGECSTRTGIVAAWKAVACEWGRGGALRGHGDYRVGAADLVRQLVILNSADF